MTFENDTLKELAYQLKEIVDATDPAQIPMPSRLKLLETMKAYSDEGEPIMGMCLYLLSSIAADNKEILAFRALDMVASHVIDQFLSDQNQN